MVTVTTLARGHRIRPVKSSTSRSPTFQINLTLACIHVNVHYVVHQSRRQPMGIDRPIEMSKSITFTLEEYLTYNQPRKAVEEIVKSWPLNDPSCQNVIDEVLKKVREAVAAMPAQRNFVSIQIGVISIHSYTHEERDDEVEDREQDHENRVIQMSMEEETERMVPALDSSIEMLETRVLEGDHHNETCSICLERFVAVDGVCEGAYMPCLHVFHGDCIEKWLRTSHYCPVCRFEMPTEIDED